MNNFFLLNEAINVTDYNRFLDGIGELVTIEREEEDHCLKHGSVWEVAIVTNNLFSHYTERERTVILFFEQLTSCIHPITNEIEFDNLFPTDENAFLGIDFLGTTIPESKQIITATHFDNFKTNNLWHITPKDFWDKRTSLFPELTLCEEVEQQILNIGESTYFNQIIRILKDFNKAVKEWTYGDFNYKKMNRDHPLRISPETDQTMNKYKSQRMFSLPNGNRECFELHIKTGDLRFHFYPDNTNRKVFIAYIGTHLT